MKTLSLALAISLLACTACNNNTNNNTHSTKDSLAVLSKEAIKIHDEIMPQIAVFDRTTIKIDSLLSTSLNAQQQEELTQLKSNLEDATDNMMTWMRDYAPDSTDINYQQAEIEKITKMKKQFEDVSLESNTKLNAYK